MKRKSITNEIMNEEVFVNSFKESNQQDSLIESFVRILNKKQILKMKHLIKNKLKMDILKLLPVEISLIILNFLSFKDIISVSKVSKYYNQLTNDDLLWKNKLYESYQLVHRFNTKKIFGQYYILSNNWLKNKYVQKSIEGPRSAIVTSLQFNDNILIIATDNATFGLIEVFNVVSGVSLGKLHGHEGGVWALEFRDNVLCSGGCDRDLRIWDISKFNTPNIHTPDSRFNNAADLDMDSMGICKYKLQGHSSTIRCLKIVNKSLVVTGSRDNSVRLWNYMNGTCEATYRGHSGSIRCIDVHQDFIVSGSYDNTLRIWNYKTHSLIHVLEGHHAQIYSVSMFGDYVCSGSLDADIRIWNAKTGLCLYTLEGHDALVGHMQLNGTTLVTGGSDGRVCVWDVTTGESILLISKAHQNSVTTLQFDKDRIISGGDDGIKIWDFKTGKLLHGMLNESTGIWRLQFNSFKLISAVQYGENTTIEILDYTMNTNLGVADKSKISLEHQAADLVLSNKRGKLMGKDYMELDNVENSSNINGF